MIAIPNMEKPKSCLKCKLITQFVMGELFCDVLDKQVSPYVIPHDCPLIEIVQCKDCKYWHEGEWYNTCDKHIGHGFEDDYFCKYGERRTDEHNTERD